MGFISHIYSAGIVVKCVVVILILLSVFSWAIIIFKFLYLRRVKKENRSFLNLWNSKKMEKEILAREVEGCNFKYGTLPHIFLSAQIFFSSHKDIEKLNNNFTVLKIEKEEELWRWLGGLATVSGVSPFVGLFGTVWGIMDAFREIAHYSSVSLTVVAPGISEALVTTAFGLAVAIPSSIFYNYFSSLIQNQMGEIEKFLYLIKDRYESR